MNIETDANVVILRRAGAVTASAYATSNGNYGRATSEVELTVEFIKPQLFLCSERGTPPDGPIEPVPDPIGDEDDDDGTGGGGDDGGTGGGGDNGGVGGGGDDGGTGGGGDNGGVGGGGDNGGVGS